MLQFNKKLTVALTYFKYFAFVVNELWYFRGLCYSVNE